MRSSRGTWWRLARTRICSAASAAPRRGSAAADRLLRQIDFCGVELGEVERDIAADALDDPVIARLMTVPGINVTVAMSIAAAVGDFGRFDSPAQLVSYLGLNPRVSQSGNSPAT